MSRESSTRGGSAAAHTVFADPVAELAVKNAKYIKLCTELYLARKSIEELRGFERFVNLEALWVNDNEIQRLSNLENNFRLKHLYAQKNQITSVAPCARFKFLESLHLFENKLSNLDKCLGVLSRLNHLKTLDLFGNPIAQEENYRLRVIHAMPPSLEVLDRQKIKAEERAQAALMFGKTLSTEGRLELRRLTSLGRQRSAAELVGELSGCTLLLLAEVDAILRKREQSSVVLEDERDEGDVQLNPVVERIKRIPDPKEGELYVVRETLSEWERRDLAAMLEKEFETSTDSWSRSTVASVVSRCESFLGRSLTLDVEAFLEILLTSLPGALVQNGDESEDSDEICEPSFEPEAVKRQLLLAKWKLWKPSQYAQESNQLFDRAEAGRKKLQTMHLTSSDANDQDADARQALQSRILADAARAYRFESLKAAAVQGSTFANTALQQQQQEDATTTTTTMTKLDESKSSNSPNDARCDVFRMYSYEDFASDKSATMQRQIPTLAKTRYGITAARAAGLRASIHDDRTGSKPSLRLFFQKL
ncbi:U2 small nuclear ribonucleoprotein A' [Hondaea fermentalgiana]|uniref:U2 small nuclear ribonucleoprotein A n=1 Tax=Hondaea fermentalgiana TaxID=2315210 RepID=A0A2R5G0S6_9STRA|nr:U2 small nuclear ribonucleoprotein A' [Hondaea fermentalgiana]|eukprot:GBG24135.1 U2 small nuclear ribonucleoprotein A' [Hondaea fermentalgiana]